MKFWIIALILAPFAALAEDAEIAAFQACVFEVPDPDMTTLYHHCAAQMVAPCGASKTAAEAVECINGARDRIAVARQKDFDALRLQAPAPDWLPEGGAATVGETLDLSVNNGKGSCMLVADRDKQDGVPVGQRAVNGAFCNLVVEGDAYGLLLNLGRQG